MKDPLFSDTVTIFNRYITSVFIPPSPPTQGIKYARTIISDVMWKDDVMVSSASDGKPMPGKTVSITIPLEAYQDGKTYIKPELFAQLQDKSEHWTIRTGNDNDIIVKGEAPEITDLYTVDQLKREFKYTSPVEVSDSADQDTLPMWKVRGV